MVIPGWNSRSKPSTCSRCSSWNARTFATVLSIARRSRFAQGLDGGGDLVVTDAQIVALDAVEASRNSRTASSPRSLTSERISRTDSTTYSSIASEDTPASLR